jgi:hypothetical protein
MSYYPQREIVVLSDDPHGVHDTRKGVIVSDINHPDIGPNQNPQRYAQYLTKRRQPTQSETTSLSC